jgi:hypothetical protein
MRKRQFSTVCVLALITVVVFGMTIVGCEEEATTGGTIRITNTNSNTYELRILNGRGENIRGGNIGAYATSEFSVNENNTYTVEYRIFFTSDSWKQKYAFVSGGGKVSVNIP